MMEGTIWSGGRVTDFGRWGRDHRFLADWIRARRFAPALQGFCSGGITLAGLAIARSRFARALLDVPWWCEPEGTTSAPRRARQGGFRRTRRTARVCAAVPCHSGGLRASIAGGPGSPPR
jgi:hypothetical protein